MQQCTSNNEDGSDDSHEDKYDNDYPDEDDNEDASQDDDGTCVGGEKMNSKIQILMHAD